MSDRWTYEQAPFHRPDGTPYERGDRISLSWTRRERLEESRIGRFVRRQFRCRTTVNGRRCLFYVWHRRAHG